MRIASSHGTQKAQWLVTSFILYLYFHSFTKISNILLQSLTGKFHAVVVTWVATLVRNFSLNEKIRILSFKIIKSTSFQRSFKSQPRKCFRKRMDFYFLPASLCSFLFCSWKNVLLFNFLPFSFPLWWELMMKGRKDERSTFSFSRYNLPDLTCCSLSCLPSLHHVFSSLQKKRRFLLPREKCLFWWMAHNHWVVVDFQKENSNSVWTWKKRENNSTVRTINLFENEKVEVQP